jgi:hypothetical protein
MQFSTALVGLVAAASTAYAQAGEIVQVTVGAGDKLQFVPNDIIAQPGTQVQFSFFPKVNTSIMSQKMPLMFTRTTLSLNPASLILATHSQPVVSSPASTQLPTLPPEPPSPSL